MPQLNPADFMPQLFWLFVTFITLYVILAKAGLPRIARLRDERVTRISNDLETAERLKREADAAAAANAAALAEARAKAAELAERTRETLKAQAESRQQAVAEQLAADIAAAEARIAAAKQQALSEMRDVATEACRDIVAKLTGLELDAQAVSSAVDRRLANVQAGKGAN